MAAIGLVEVVRTAQAYGTTFFNFAGFTVAAGLFVVLTIPLARFTDWLIAREQRKGICEFSATSTWRSPTTR